MKVTLLGTGMPAADPKRRGPSQVIEIGDDLLFIDVGAGALHRFVESGYVQPRPLGQSPRRRPELRRILFTHLHSDHTTGLADLLWSGWISRLWDQPPVIAGPPGTARFVEKLIDAYSYDIRVRTGGEELRRESLVPRVEEIEEGWTLEGDGWRVSAFRVEHEPVDQAFGYRIDANSTSAVFSGDTHYSENLIKHAQNADLLVHEVYWAKGMRDRITPDMPASFRRRVDLVAGYHTASDQVGKVAAAANARHLVLNHIIMAGGSTEALIDDIRPDFRGEVTVGEDLMAFDLNHH
jgi:ribonuclease Z